MPVRQVDKRPGSQSDKSFDSILRIIIGAAFPKSRKFRFLAMLFSGRALVLSRVESSSLKRLPLSVFEDFDSCDRVHLPRRSAPTIGARGMGLVEE